MAADRPVAAVDLGIAARSVGLSETADCGSCHFAAGGGDIVKKGDIGSALVGADLEIDFHMGRGMACADCYSESGHVLLGQGIDSPVSQGRPS